MKQPKKHYNLEFKDFYRTGLSYDHFHDGLQVRLEISFDKSNKSWNYDGFYYRTLKSGKEEAYYCLRGTVNSKEKALLKINNWINSKSIKKSYHQELCKSCGQPL